MSARRAEPGRRPVRGRRLVAGGWIDGAHAPSIAPELPAEAITSLRIVRADVITLATLRLPPPLQASGAGVAPVRLARDGRDGADPAPHRKSGRRDLGRQPRQERPVAARARDPRRGRPAPGPDGRSADHRGQGVGSGRVRPARADVRAATAPGARLLRHAADRPAHVPRDGRSAVDPVLPGLRPDLPHPELPHDRAGEHRDVRARPVAGGPRACSRARSWSRRPPATAA